MADFLYFCQSMSKNPKENIITEILVLLESGITRKDCLPKIVNRWQISDRTFDRYWKTALENHAETQSTIQSSIAEISIEAFRENFTGKILTVLERKEILTQMALGNIPLTKYIVCDGTIQEREVVPSWSDRKAAIAELNKMEGVYVAEEKPEDEIQEIKVIRIGNGA